MNKAELFAQRLVGRQYGTEITLEEEKFARDNNLLVLFATSDDILGLRGIIDDEIGAWGGTTIWVTNNGKHLTRHNDVIDEEKAITFLNSKGYKITEPQKIKIDLLWSPKDLPFSCSWKITSNAPKQASFHVMDWDNVYCVGLVIEF